MATRFARLLMLAAAVGAALSVSGCDVKLETMIVHPQTVWTFYAGANDSATFSCFPFTCFNTSGTGPAWVPSPPGRFSVGFDHWLDEGTPPCNCWEAVSYAYRGAVRFDTSKLPKTFVSATLKLEPTESDWLEGDTQSNDEPGTIAGIWLAANNWEAGVNALVFTDENGTETGHVELPFPAGSEEFVVPFPENPGPKFPEKGFPVRKEGSTYIIEASNQFRAWQKGSEPNHGFVFVGRDESLALKQNRVRVSRYKVWLVVTFNPNAQP